MHSQQKCIRRQNVCSAKCENGVRTEDQDCKCCRCGANTHKIFNIIHAFVWILRELIEIRWYLNRFICVSVRAVCVMCIKGSMHGFFHRRRRLAPIRKEAIVASESHATAFPSAPDVSPYASHPRATYIFMICWHRTDCRMARDFSLISLLFLCMCMAAFSSITIYSNTSNTRRGSDQILIWKSILLMWPPVSYSS